MLGELQLIEGTREIPRGAGVEDLLGVLRNLLRLPRVQHISIDHTGVVRYRVYARPEELEEPAGVELQHLEPYAVLRNAIVHDYTPAEFQSAVDLPLLHMLRQTDLQQLYPVAWVVGTASALIGANVSPMLGLRVYRDAHVENNVVFLCAALVPQAQLVDTRWVLKYTLDDNSYTPDVVFGEVLNVKDG